MAHRRLTTWTKRLACLLVSIGLLLTGVNCIAPASFRAVKQPRAGRPLNNRVAIVYSRHYQVELAGAEKLHPFDINKYAKIYLKLNTDGLIRPGQVYVPAEISRESLELVHDSRYLDSLGNAKVAARYLEANVVGALPGGVVDGSILRPFRYATGGTLLAARLAQLHGVAVNLAGGYHHAWPGRGGGFCIYADMPVAIRVMQREGLIERALVVDLDAHQGDGTAVCLADDDTTFTFSMHEQDRYPHPKQKSDLDIGLDSGTDDRTYLDLLAKHLPRVLERADPDIVFLQAGCDVLREDPLTDLAMTRDGIVRRDAMVIDACVQRGIPVVMVLGGGYSEQAWSVQYDSIRRTIETYGLADGRAQHPRRNPTVKEKLYTK